jgi:hypothetical protein
MADNSYTVVMENQTIVADATLVIIHAAASWGTAGSLLEVKRCTISQQGTSTSQQLGAIIARKVTAFGTYTSTTPTPHIIGAAASAIVGGTTGAAATSGTDASAEGAGAVTAIHTEGFNNLSGFLWVPTPTERLLLGPDQVVILKIRGTPTTLTGWNATMAFEQIA